ncbi:equilibrative nucleoside transporter 3-like [Dermatophagoides pteronyssinus]|uniref:equilibrative nucleoside transporter 3-like n=1 Tax=Dermatophagoides pteronyssinus TaxID=6956 RepID=UPI003F681124
MSSSRSDVEPILNINDGDMIQESLSEPTPPTIICESSTNNDNDNGENDRYHLVRILFFLIGLTQLLPMNFLITADDLWKYKFRNVNSTNIYNYNDDSDKTKLQTFFDSYLIIACNSPFLLVYLVSMTRYFQRITNDLKIFLSFSFTIITFMIITSLVKIDTDEYQNAFLIILLILVFIVNAAAIFIQAIFTGLAALFPLKYIQSMVAGQAMSGLFAALTKIFSLLGHRTLINNVFIFFLLANLVLIVTFALFLYVRNKSFYSSYAYASNSLDSNVPLNLSLFGKIFQQIWPFCLTLTIVFWVTLSIYPGLFVLITPVDHKNQILPEKFILPITCFLVFNLGDFFGRFFGKYILLSKTHSKTILILSFGRILFIPLFLYCNAQPRHHSVLFPYEMIFVLFNFIFALMNGYLVLNVFVNGPQLIPDEYRHMSGYFLIAFLGAGLTLGSLTSPLILDLL